MGSPVRITWCSISSLQWAPVHASHHLASHSKSLFWVNFRCSSLQGLQIVVCMVSFKFLFVICNYLKVYQLHCIHGVAIREWCNHSVNKHCNRKPKTWNLTICMRGPVWGGLNPFLYYEASWLWILQAVVSKCLVDAAQLSSFLHSRHPLSPAMNTCGINGYKKDEWLSEIINLISNLRNFSIWTSSQSSNPPQTKTSHHNH